MGSSSEPMDAVGILNEDDGTFRVSATKVIYKSFSFRLPFSFVILVLV